MTLIAVFLAADQQTLLTERVAHISTTAIEDEDEGCTYYEHHFFFLHEHHLALVSSEWAHDHCGCFLGVIEEGTDPETLRETAFKHITDAHAQTARAN